MPGPNHHPVAPLLFETHQQGLRQVATSPIPHPPLHLRDIHKGPPLSSDPRLPVQRSLHRDPRATSLQEEASPLVEAEVHGTSRPQDTWEAAHHLPHLHPRAPLTSLPDLERHLADHHPPPRPPTGVHSTLPPALQRVTPAGHDRPWPRASSPPCPPSYLAARSNPTCRLS